MYLAKEYADWRAERLHQWHIEADKHYAEHKGKETKTIYGHLPYTPPPKPDMSFQAFMDELVKRLPLG